MPRKHTKRNGVSKGYIPKTLFIKQLIAMLLLLSSVQVNASISKKLYQDIDVKGKVVDINGAPIPGVSVNVKGSKKSTVTNGQGAFTISVSPNDLLMFSIISIGSLD